MCVGVREWCAALSAFSGSDGAARVDRGDAWITSRVGWLSRLERCLCAEETLLAGLGGEGVATVGESEAGWEMTESWARLLLLPLEPRSGRRAWMSFSL